MARPSAFLHERQRTARPGKGPKTVFRLLGLCLVAALGFFSAACPNKKPKYPACGNDKDCAEGEFCVNKICVKCRANTDCARGEQCVKGACKAIPGWCGNDDDCDPTQTCKNGKCSACQDDSECGDGGKCNAGKCLRKGMCSVDEDCAEDEFCENGKCSKGGGGGGGGTASCTLNTIYFETNAFELSEEALGILAANAECIKSQGRSVALIGHTDPRHTEEYNLALSERRARSVKEKLTPMVGGGTSLRLVPKGELESSGTDDDSFARDRRVEFQWE